MRLNQAPKLKATKNRIEVDDVNTHARDRLCCGWRGNNSVSPASVGGSLRIFSRSLIFFISISSKQLATVSNNTTNPNYCRLTYSSAGEQEKFVFYVITATETLRQQRGKSGAAAWKPQADAGLRSLQNGRQSKLTITITTFSYSRQTRTIKHSTTLSSSYANVCLSVVYWLIGWVGDWCIYGTVYRRTHFAFLTQTEDWESSLLNLIKVK